jgi:hypothetical protein
LHVAEREASGDFDYQLDDSPDDDGLTSHDPAAETPENFDYLLNDPDESGWDDGVEAGDDGHFDAFNDRTWHFKAAPIPWYRTKQATTALVAAAAATAAIVVSGVLLVFHGPNATVVETPSVTPTAPTSDAAPTSAAAPTSDAAPTSAAAPTEVATEVATSAPPPPPAASPPPPPPPPPAVTSAAPVNRAPEVNYPSVRPRPTKQPEIGVTRTPATRQPISVAPQTRAPRN